MTGPEILRAAAAIVRTPGRWCQGSAWRDKGGKACYVEQAEACCAMGAIDLVALVMDADREDMAEAQHRLGRVVLKLHNNPFVSNFNDLPGRTAEEVAEVLEKAAEL